MTEALLPVLLDTATAATYAGVRPVTLRVWRHRYGLTAWTSPEGANLYVLDELAAILGRRAEPDAGRITGAGLDRRVIGRHFRCR